MDSALTPARTPLASSSAVRRLVLGLVVVVLDLRIEGFDLLVDAVGWIVVVGALGELVRRVPGLRAARTTALVAVPLSVADLLHPTRTVVSDSSGDGSMTTSTTVVVDPAGVHGGTAAAYAALCVVFLVLVLVVLAGAAAREGVPSTATRLRRLAVVTAAVQGTGVVVSTIGLAHGVQDASAAGAESGLAPLLLLLAAGGFATVVWVLVSLWRLRTWPLLLTPSDTGVRTR